MHFDWFLVMIYWRTDAWMILLLITFSFFRFHAVVGQYSNGSQRHQNVVRTPVTHWAVLSVPLVCSYHI